MLKINSVNINEPSDLRSLARRGTNCILVVDVPAEHIDKSHSIIVGNFFNRSPKFTRNNHKKQTRKEEEQLVHVAGDHVVIVPI